MTRVFSRLQHAKVVSYCNLASSEQSKCKGKRHGLHPRKDLAPWHVRQHLLLRNQYGVLCMCLSKPQVFDMILLITSIFAILLLVYLWHASRALYYPGPEAATLTSQPWSKDEILQAYKKTENSRDTTPLLPRKQRRRYIIVGGSGSFTTVSSSPLSCKNFAHVGRLMPSILD